MGSASRGDRADSLWLREFVLYPRLLAHGGMEGLGFHQSPSVRSAVSMRRRSSDFGRSDSKDIACRLPGRRLPRHRHRTPAPWLLPSISPDVRRCPDSGKHPCWRGDGGGMPLKGFPPSTGSRSRLSSSWPSEPGPRARRSRSSPVNRRWPSPTRVDRQECRIFECVLPLRRHVREALVDDLRGHQRGVEFWKPPRPTRHPLQVELDAFLGDVAVHPVPPHAR